ncbi:MAG: hypothetical protein JZU65_21615 [Chlorobium sp.]|nr:hypothetical protein [Chlorobium sp.]
MIRFDEQMVPGTSVNDLTPALWNRFRTAISPKTNIKFLEKMKLLSKDEEGINRATVSGILMASEVPIIITESEALSGNRSVYKLIADSELLLTIYAARLPHGD